MFGLVFKKQLATLLVLVCVCGPQAFAALPDEAVEEAKAKPAEEQGPVTSMQIGLSAVGTYDETGSSAVGTFAQLYGRYMQGGSREYNPYAEKYMPYVPLITLAEGELQYNVINASSEGASTGARIAATLFIGAHNRRANEVCNFYGGAHSVGWAAAYVNQAGSTTAGVAVGPETGLLCQKNDVLFMISPTVEYGTAQVWGHPKQNSFTQGVQAGLVARLALGDRLFLHLRGVSTVATGQEIIGKEQILPRMTMGEFKGDIRLSLRWRLQGFVRVLKMDAAPLKEWAAELPNQGRGESNYDALNVTGGLGLFGAF